MPDYSDKQLHHWRPKVIEFDNPGEWPGEGGRGYKTRSNKTTYKRYFKTHQFNILASDQIALNRSLKDQRHHKCLSKQYMARLPTTSVIIVFHNEAFSTLLRTVHSVIKTSSDILLEIILVDDSSSKLYLKRQLEEYVTQLSVPVRIIRLAKRSGLIWARLLGSAHAKGQVITFLDSHCECNEGWLEPLLDRIAQDRSRIVSPLIDVIDEHSFEYIPASETTYGGFNWKIGFRWYDTTQTKSRRQDDLSLPLRSATLSGGLFAVDRDFFNYIGKIDPGMIIWGAENLEISFRSWMCGGSLEIVPCSRVGHIFRAKTPYTLPGGADHIVWHNTARLAEVWLDDWKHFYYALHPGARLIDHGDVHHRVALRHQLNCKWYLDNIYPESRLPRDYHLLGDLRNDRNHCLDTSAEDLFFKECTLIKEKRIAYNQLFLYSKENQIINDEKCLDGSAVEGLVGMVSCNEDRDQQRWLYDRQRLTLLNSADQRCLDVKRHNSKTILYMNDCREGSSTQKWLLSDNFEWHSPQHTDRHSP